jgi:hypothetical protein
VKVLDPTRETRGGRSCRDLPGEASATCEIGRPRREVRARAGIPSASQRAKEVDMRTRVAKPKLQGIEMPAAARADARLQAQIAEAAYYRAERRGFAPGQEIEDWLAAEAEVLARVGADERPS